MQRCAHVTPVSQFLYYLPGCKAAIFSLIAKTHPHQLHKSRFK